MSINIINGSRLPDPYKHSHIQRIPIHIVEANDELLSTLYIRCSLDAFMLYVVCPIAFLPGYVTMVVSASKSIQLPSLGPQMFPFRLCFSFLHTLGRERGSVIVRLVNHHVSSGMWSWGLLAACAADHVAWWWKCKWVSYYYHGHKYTIDTDVVNNVHWPIGLGDSGSRWTLWKFSQWNIILLS